MFEVNGEAVEHNSFAVLPVADGSSFVWHKFSVMPNLPLELLFGANVLAPHF